VAAIIVNDGHTGPVSSPRKPLPCRAHRVSRNCASNKPAIVGVVMHGLDMIAPVSGARFNRSVPAQLPLVVLPLAFNIEKCDHTSTLNHFIG
jgi:hypothetical protein